MYCLDLLRYIKKFDFGIMLGITFQEKSALIVRSILIIRQYSIQNMVRNKIELKMQDLSIIDTLELFTSSNSHNV